ncbi:MAG: type II and III secretion system protein [Proteobacteria bacterium]|nr:type II and III secretion system protein [Pseudomonadota bacterium]
MAFRNLAAGVVTTALLAGCSGLPSTRVQDAHIQAETTAPADGNIPPAVQIAPVLPKPKATSKPETYSVVVNNVRVQELLFALARDAKLNVDVHPGVTGNVTLNAIDQTLPQLLTRIARQVDMRYEVDGPNLIIMRDTPYLRIYRIDYLNITRTSTSQLGVSSQVSAAGSSGGSGGVGTITNNSTSTVNNISNNRFWDTLVANVRDLLRESDKLIPGQPIAAASTTPPAQPGAAPPSAPPSAPPVSGLPPSGTPATTGSQSMEFREAASVISNPEAGILSIRATSRQHEKIQEFLDQVMTSVKRQVLIEATVAEVQLNNQYQRGIDWSKLRTGSAGFQFQQSSGATPAGVNTNSFVVGYAAANQNFSAALKLLESFGDVKVLSSPKISVLNNQPALLKVVDNLVFFTIQASTVSNTNAPAVTTFTTTLNSVPVGFVMSVTPQISESDTVLLNLRPTISRKIGDVADPNPSLSNPCGVGVQNCATPAIQSLIPVIQTREMESLLRVQSGQVAVLGGLIQDQITNIEDGIPGVNRTALGDLFRQRKDTATKTELVIFLRPVVIRDPSIEGDYHQFRNMVPDADYLRRPNPAKAEAYGGQPAR